MSSSSIKLRTSRLSGNYNDCQPLFVDSLRLLLVGYGSAIQSVSMDTGELLGKFSGHSNLVSCISSPNLLHSSMKDAKQTLALSAALDGVIFVWRIEDFQIVNRLDIGIPVYKVIIPQVACNGNLFSEQSARKASTNEQLNRAVDELYIVVGKNPKHSDNNDSAHKLVHESSMVDDKFGAERFKLVMYDTNAFKVRRKVSTMRNAKQCVCSLSVDNEEYAVVASKRRILLYSMHSRQGPKISSSTGLITCVTACQATGVIVTGHEKGEISVWHNIPQWVRSYVALGKELDANNLQPPVFTLLHWHAHAVQAIGMSHDGQYIYSGGEEAVLVVWQVSTSIKAFVPRLGGAITHIGTSVENAKTAAATMDNCVHVVDTARLREEWSLRGLFVPAPIRGGAGTSLGGLHSVEKFLYSDANYRCNIRIDPISGLVMCSGYPGQLQGLELGHRGLRGNHEIAQFTRVSKTESKTRIYVPTVTHFEYTARGERAVLVSVDVRRGEDKDRTASLKFWTHDESRNEYKLSAQVEQPHGTSRINAVALHVTRFSEAVCVTGAADGSVKLWRTQQQSPAPPNSRGDSSAPLVTAAAATQGSKDGLGWTCAFSFRYRDSPVLACTISRDGTALAVAQENVVSIWDPVEVGLRATLLAPCSDAITYMAFLEPRASAEMGGGAGQAYLVVGSKVALYLYNLLTLQLIWVANGDFLAFAVACSEVEALPIQTKGSMDYAYIAAAVRNDVHLVRKEECPTPNKEVKKNVHTNKAPGSTSKAAASEAEDEDYSSDGARGPEHQVCFFSISSPVPVVAEKLSSGVSTMCFVAQGLKSVRPQPVSGLLCIADSSELLLIAPISSDPNSRDVSMEAVVGDTVAKSFTKVLPTLPQSLDRGQVGENVVSPAFRSAAHQSLSSLFNERSEALPAVSALSSSFLGRLLRENISILSSRSEQPTSNVTNVDEFVLPGMGGAGPQETQVGTTADTASDETESRVFFKRARSRSMSFEARNGLESQAATAGKPNVDANFVRQRLELFGNILNDVLATNGTEAPKASRISQTGKPVTKKAQAEIGLKVVSEARPTKHSDDPHDGPGDELEAADDIQVEKEKSETAPVSKKARSAGPATKASKQATTVQPTSTGRASRSNSISSAASDTAARSKVPPASSDASEGRVTRRGRAGSATSDISDDSSAAPVRTIKRKAK